MPKFRAVRHALAKCFTSSERGSPGLLSKHNRPHRGRSDRETQLLPHQRRNPRRLQPTGVELDNPTVPSLFLGRLLPLPPAVRAGRGAVLRTLPKSDFLLAATHSTPKRACAAEGQPTTPARAEPSVELARSELHHLLASFAPSLGDRAGIRHGEARARAVLAVASPELSRRDAPCRSAHRAGDDPHAAAVSEATRARAVLPTGLRPIRLKGHSAADACLLYARGRRCQTAGPRAVLRPPALDLVRDCLECLAAVSADDLNPPDIGAPCTQSRAERPALRRRPLAALAAWWSIDHLPQRCGVAHLPAVLGNIPVATAGFHVDGPTASRASRSLRELVASGSRIPAVLRAVAPLPGLKVPSGRAKRLSTTPARPLCHHAPGKARTSRGAVAPPATVDVAGRRSKCPPALLAGSIHHAAIVPENCFTS